MKAQHFFSEKLNSLGPWTTDKFINDEVMKIIIQIIIP